METTLAIVGLLLGSGLFSRGCKLLWDTACLVQGMKAQLEEHEQDIERLKMRTSELESKVKNTN